MHRYPIVVATMLLAGATDAAHADTRSPPRSTTAPAPSPAVELAYDRFTLSNGLTTLVHTDRSVPSVYVGIWYRTGSRDEPAGRTGFAHLFEHLMFQQTANRKGEYLAVMNGAGASGLNGTTTADFTSYYQTVPTNALDLALWMESDRMGYLDGGITQAVLDEQRGVVQNEMRQGQSAVGDAATEQFYRGYYPDGHPYAHSVIGTMADLDAATVDDVRRWFKDHYGASNAVLVLVGDIDAATAREKVTRYFGGLPAGKDFARPTQWVPALTADRRDVMYADGAGATLTRSWPVSASDPRAATLLLLAARTMTAVRNSPFVAELVDTAKVATGVDAQFDVNQLDARFTIRMALRPGVTPTQAGAALDAAIDRFVATGPTADALGSIRRGTDTAILRALDSNASVGEFLVDGELRRGDPVFFLKQREWALAATSADVRGVVGKWLKRPYYEQGILPQPAAPVAGRTADVDRTRLPEPGPLKTTIAVPPITEITLANGMKLAVAYRPKLPLVDVTMRFDTGSSVDRDYAPGAAAAAFGLMRRGTTTLSGDAIAERSSVLDIATGTNVGDRSSSFIWNAGTARLEDSFALASDMLRRPAYDAAQVRAVAGDAEPGAPSQDGSSVAERLLARAIWGGDDPRGQSSRPQDRRALTRDQVTRFHDREIGPANATLLMVGDVTPERARALADRYFGDWRRNAPTAFPPLPVAVAQSSRIILVDAPGAPQSIIRVGEIVRPFAPDAAAAESLANAILADPSDGRLNMNLREGKGWTYGFGGGIGPRPSGARLFVASGGVQTDRTAAAMAEIRREIADFVTTRPLTADELTAAQSARVRSLPLQLADAPGILAAMTSASANNLPYDRIRTGAERTAAVTLAQAQAAAASLYSPDRLVWVVVGDLKTIEPGVRALNMSPVEVWDATGKRVR